MGKCKEFSTAQMSMMLHENQTLQKYLSTANTTCTLTESCLSLCFEHRYPTTVTEAYLLRNPNYLYIGIQVLK